MNQPNDPQSRRDDENHDLPEKSQETLLARRDYYLALAEEAAPRLNEAEQGEWLARLEAEHENFRWALSWSLQLPGDGVAAALRLCGALQPFWRMRGHIEEGRQWCEAALNLADASDRSAEYARALHSTGILARMQGDYAVAQAHHERSLAIRREIGESASIATSLTALGNLAYAQGHYAAARDYHEQCLAIKHERGDQAGIAGSLNNLGLVAYAQGDYVTARGDYTQSLALRRDLQNGNVEAIATTLEGVAEVVAAEEDWERGARLWAAVQALREQVGSLLSPGEQEAFDRNVAAARQALGEQAFSAAWAKGGAMTLEQSIEYALETSL